MNEEGEIGVGREVEGGRVVEREGVREVFVVLEVVVMEGVREKEVVLAVVGVV